MSKSKKLKEGQNRRKRKVDLVIISDVHLGTYGCHAKELLLYLKSIKPKKVILNGDIIDVWQFKKRYWPKSHMKIIKHLIGWMSQGVEMYYITGNHDEIFRKFVNFEIGSLKIVNQLELEIDGKKAWIFHGDVFDVTMQYSKWLTKLGAIGYDLLILINKLVNNCSQFFGKGKISLSKKIKDKVKSAVKFINDFENTATEIGVEKGYDYVICGHIHQPEMKEFKHGNKRIQYLNSGDWIENLTALEYHKGSWNIFQFKEEYYFSEHEEANDITDKTSKEIFGELLNDFNIGKR
ncbi:UDP-2,3-diacylglucosamine diphosphatase [Aureivirga marina]|uniref:UDP-2,3-diacylglucosamine diphosphatase n=1 Tax=Aureivirga marina TaxID=1182451 RepID=UPI0018C9F808|nr:UDP-2,3-diacylglucosamine diphosphatase [Aureivirga marina]